MHGRLADETGLVERRPVAQLHAGVPSPVRHVAHGTVDVEVYLGAVGEAGAVVEGIGIGGQCGGLPARGFVEQADVGVGADLVVGDGAEVVGAVHLAGGEAEDEAGSAGVAEHAFVAAGVVPGLFAGAAVRLAEAVGLVESAGGDEGSFGLLLVPGVGVADPVVFLFHDDAGFDVTAGGGVSFFHVEGEGLDGDRAVVELPGGVGLFVKADAGVGRKGDEAFFVGTVGPEGRVDLVGQDAGGDLMAADARKQAGLAQLAGEGGGGGRAQGCVRPGGFRRCRSRRRRWSRRGRRRGW